MGKNKCGMQAWHELYTSDTKYSKKYISTSVRDRKFFYQFYVSHYTPKFYFTKQFYKSRQSIYFTVCNRRKGKRRPLLLFSVGNAFKLNKI